MNSYLPQSRRFFATLPRFGSSLALALLLGSCGGADFRYLDGVEGRVEDWDGRWVVVNFWAEWCKPCRQEMPALDRLQARHGNWQVVGINFDGMKDVEQRRLREQFGIRYALLSSEPPPRLGLELPAVLPTTWLRTPEGRWLGPLHGEQSEADIEDLIQAKEKS